MGQRLGIGPSIPCFHSSKSRQYLAGRLRSVPPACASGGKTPLELASTMPTLHFACGTARQTLSLTFGSWQGKRMQNEGAIGPEKPHLESLSFIADQKSEGGCSIRRLAASTS